MDLLILIYLKAKFATIAMIKIKVFFFLLLNFISLIFMTITTFTTIVVMNYTVKFKATTIIARIFIVNSITHIDLMQLKELQ